LVLESRKDRRNVIQQLNSWKRVTRSQSGIAADKPAPLTEREFLACREIVRKSVHLKTRNLVEGLNLHQICIPSAFQWQLFIYSATNCFSRAPPRSRGDLNMGASLPQESIDGLGCNGMKSLL
jgi:hypothetical protein